MTAIDLTNVLFAGANAVLAVVLAVVYWRNHRTLRSPFTLGLMLFAAFLIVHNSVALYDFWTMMGMYDARTANVMLVENVLLLAASGALVSATLR